MSYTKHIFAFYFVLFFMLSFAWMDLSRSEFDTADDEYFAEQRIDPAPNTSRTPNVPLRRVSKADSDFLVTPQSTPTPGLASAPEKLTFRILTEQPVNDELLQQFRSIVSSQKFESKVTPVTLELVDNRTEPRGKMTREYVSLVVPLASPSENIKVLVHELGHVVDIHFLKSGVFESDPSQAFYEYSWVDMSTKKEGVRIEDFVSGYAMTNKYEDFAESFTYFVFHNEDFVVRAKSNPLLAKKYAFFRKYVFPENEFEGTKFGSAPLPLYTWDTTKIPVALNKYLFYIK